MKFDNQISNKVLLEELKKATLENNIQDLKELEIIFFNRFEAYYIDYIPKNKWSDCLFNAGFIEYRIEEDLEELLNDLVVKIWWDHYDNSIELGFSSRTPDDFRGDEKLSELLLNYGFSTIYLNFTDGSQQVMNKNFKTSVINLGERKIYNDNSWRWGKEKANKLEGLPNE